MWPFSGLATGSATTAAFSTRFSLWAMWTCSAFAIAGSFGFSVILVTASARDYARSWNASIESAASTYGSGGVAATAVVGATATTGGVAIA